MKVTLTELMNTGQKVLSKGEIMHLVIDLALKLNISIKYFKISLNLLKIWFSNAGKVSELKIHIYLSIAFYLLLNPSLQSVHAWLNTVRWVSAAGCGI